MRNFREYDVWIDVMEAVDNVYKLTDGFPSDERFLLTSNIIRSAVSIPSNIAEATSRTSEKDFARFLEYSLGASFEFEILLKNVIRLQKRIFALRKKVLNG